MEKSAASDQRPRAYRVKDACTILGISKSSLYRLAKNGKIKLVRIGGRTLLPDFEVDRLTSEGA
jgi:excisionase family DNA binding protein